MINAQDIKIGTCIRMDGKLYFCIDFLHVKPVVLISVRNWKTYVWSVVLTNISIMTAMTTSL